MVTLPPGGWRSRASLVELVELLGGDAETRAVGGAVRDTLLDLPVADIDLATRLRPDEVMTCVQASRFKAVPTGLKHGTVTAVTPDGPVEVTTLRRDVATDGRHAEVAFTDDWRADAARRDFTINALYGDIGDGRVSDYFDGLSDLDARRVRFIGEPLERIAEDHLRILRFFRFHARFGNGLPDAAGLAACIARANDLMALSRERIASELLRLLASDDPAPTLAVMVAQGILRSVLPEIDAAGVARLAALALIESDPSAIRRLAALLGPDEALASGVAARLKLSKAQSKRLTLAAGWTEAGAPPAMAYRLGVESAADRLLLRGDAEAAATLAPPPSLPIRGADLIGRGLASGPDVGQALARIEAAWIAAGFPQGPALDALVAEQLER
ncbi:Polynucleotide adenylyltransferase [Sphingomonas antarctica]|uniref:CCA tRNA nucleotidyltransferase n=1 Tax=Sphingomonas antarctica TaxID=2040274 RepID=UPI0039ECD495